MGLISFCFEQWLLFIKSERKKNQEKSSYTQSVANSLGLTGMTSPGNSGFKIAAGRKIKRF
jgi:hypothetical protein